MQVCQDGMRKYESDVASPLAMSQSQWVTGRGGSHCILLQKPVVQGCICHGEGNGNPLQYPCLENPMDGGAWWVTVHGVAKSQTRLSDFTHSLRASLVAQMVKHLPTMWETQVWSLGQEDPLEKEMATHSSIHARKIPWTKKPSRLQSMGLQRVGHNWATSALIF